MEQKERLDKLLVDKGLIDSREKAKRYIMANLVKVNGITVNKAGTRCEIDSQLYIKKDASRFVSRGGDKLEKALTEFGIDVNGKTIIDVGASTGGFTDCLLKYGAKKVYCVDVGYGQLDWALRKDERVVCIERTNIRYLDKDRFDFLFDLATVDVSFISLEKVFPVLDVLLKDKGEVIALIKPQFEAGKDLVKKGGIVDDPAVHQEVINNILKKVRSDFLFLNLTFSPIKNYPGNIEYLVYLIKNKGYNDLNLTNINLIKKIVNEAHHFFSSKESLS
ncbi:MAG: TlyA family RNA methyltransferase [Atribacterota bacterium]|jgi:23S rRNA (cytidine1920-2'-O)/16S rRNA (cytidine1409-2'-O)-methyltransferase|nr:TlyA family RNA methyltransferase [Atribacterota bacterium]